MYFNEFDTDEVKQAIESLAKECADDNEWADGVDLWERVYQKTEDWCTYPIDHIKLCAYYEPNTCSTMFGSYEDTPFAQFENDVYDRAVELRNN